MTTVSKQEQESASAPFIEIDHFGAAFGDRVILADISFTALKEEITVLMGPMGTGKSVLLRALSLLNENNPRYRSWGRIEINGEVLSPANALPLVIQSGTAFNSKVIDYFSSLLRPRLETPFTPRELREYVSDKLLTMKCDDLLADLDQLIINLNSEKIRRVLILGQIMNPVQGLLIDEPTTGLKGDQAESILALIRRIADTICPIVVTLHNQQQARNIGSHIILMAGGRVQADCDAKTFFTEPPNEVAQQFVRTGSCHIPSPDATAEELSEDVSPPPELPLTAQIAVKQVGKGQGPRNFKWVIPGKIAATPLPGVVADINYDLAALRLAGVTTLITLTRHDLPQDALHRQGLRNLHLSIYDREAPTIGQVKMLVKHMTRMIERGEVLAVHCRAGIGRTGTVIAGWLICEGLSAEAALERIRKIDPEFVQTRDQEDFLFELERNLVAGIKND